MTTPKDESHPRPPSALDEALDAEPTPAELELARGLRVALERHERGKSGVANAAIAHADDRRASRLEAGNRAGAMSDAELLFALAAAYDPKPIDEAVHREIVDHALARATAPARTASALASAKKRSWSGAVVFATFGGAGALAVAAALLLVVRSDSPDAATTSQDEARMPPVALAEVRSTAPLFTEPFSARQGTASSRIDRIARARSHDLRDNRFARWGVREAGVK